MLPKKTNGYLLPKKQMGIFWIEDNFLDDICNIFGGKHSSLFILLLLGLFNLSVLYYGRQYLTIMKPKHWRSKGEKLCTHYFKKKKKLCTFQPTTIYHWHYILVVGLVNLVNVLISQRETIQFMGAIVF